MTIKKLLRHALSLSLAVTLFPTSVDLKALDLPSVINAAGTVEIVEGESGEPIILLHGTPVIIQKSRYSADTNIIIDANKNGKVDSGEVPINLKQLANSAGISGNTSMGFDLADVTIYGIGGFGDSYYTEHTGDVLITYKGGDLGGVIGSTGEVDQTGDFVFNASEPNAFDTTTIKKIEGSGPGIWNGDVSLIFDCQELFVEEVYGGSKNDTSVINGDVSIIGTNHVIISFGDIYNPGNGGILVGGTDTTINGSFNIEFDDWGGDVTNYGVIDAWDATVTESIEYNLGTVDFYEIIRTNEDTPVTSIVANSITHSGDGRVYLGEGEFIESCDRSVIESSRYGIPIDPEDKSLGTVVVKAGGTTIFKDPAKFLNTYLGDNKGFELNSNNEIVIGRASSDVMLITFDTGTSDVLGPLLVIKGDTTVLPTITRNGYTFTGWSDGRTTYPAGANYTIPASDITLNAVWELNYVEPTPTPTPSKGTGFVDKKGDTYFYVKGKQVKDGFVVVDKNKKFVELLAPQKLAELADKEYAAYFTKPDGIVAKAEWIILDIDGNLVDTLPIGEFNKKYGKEYKVYMADQTGKLLRNWFDIEGNWYYFNDDFSAKRQFWLASGKNWFLFSNYSILTNEWSATTNGRWYFFDTEGKMVRNTWVDGCWINGDGIYWSPTYSDPNYVANYKE